jgi:SAM-dependent methyltransferase
MLMGPRPDYRETAQAWDVVARVKYKAEFQDHIAFLRSGQHNLLQPEAEILRELLPGAHVVQLQCSHGLDALGLLNAGASSVVGVDISGEMITQAKAKAEAVGANSASFLCYDVTQLPKHLHGSADLVYTGRGSLPWVLDLEAWAQSVAGLLRPGAHVFVFEGHPLASLWDRESTDVRLRGHVGYFDLEPREDPGFPASIVRRESGTVRPRMLERHWPPGEVIDALIQVGLDIRLFREFPVLFWDQFPNWPEELKSRLPNSYAILAQRKLGR